jgi:hypothetical protein
VEKMALLTAGTDRQFSNALTAKEHRLFSYYLIKALLKGYDNVGELSTKVQADVTEKSRELGGLNKQTPVMSGNSQLRM